MKPEIVIETVYEEVTPNELPLYLTGYDPYTDQNFRGRFTFSGGILNVVEYQPDRGQKLSSQFYQYAKLFVKTFEEKYRKGN